jgi:PAS domain S-box-containing protein
MRLPESAHPAARRALEALRRERDFSSAVVDTTGALVVVVDRQGRITRFNPACQALTGLTAAQAAGRRLWEVLATPADEHAVRAAVLRAAGGPPLALEWHVGAADGQRRFVTWSVTSVTAGGRGGGDFAVATGIDITDRRLAEEALARTAAELRRHAAELQRSNHDLAQFADAASHDLTEPLRMVASYVQLLGHRYRGRLDADADEIIGFAAEGVRRMKTLLDDLLAYSRAGSTEWRPAVADCGELVERALRGLDGRVRDAGASVTVGPLPVVAGDPAQLQEIFRQLLGNALKFCDGRPPQVRIGADRDQDGWRFWVADNGIGIDPRHAGQLFQMFKRLHARARYDGNGAGLAICRRLVERHGGRIWVEPNPGGGSVFNFTVADDPAALP